jgi:pyruvate, water dikinase
MSQIIYSLRNSNLLVRSQVGGKAASLGEVMSLGLQVPPGFVITTDACQEIHYALESVNSSVSTQAPECLRTDAANMVNQANAFLKLPEKLVCSVIDAYRMLGQEVGDPEPSVAVRSSAVDEDQAHQSFAGQFKTYLGVKGEKEVLDALQKCIFSMYTSAVLEYRTYFNQLDTASLIAVIIQQMVPASASGVLFTQNAINGDLSVIHLESCVGLGEPLVSGDVTPDLFLVSKLSGTIIQRQIRPQKFCLYLDKASGHCVRTMLHEFEQNKPSISDEEISSLVSIARRIEHYFGCQMDIEWIISRSNSLESRFYIVQARPVTVAAHKPIQQSQSVLTSIVASLCKGHQLRPQTLSGDFPFSKCI